MKISLCVFDMKALNFLRSSWRIKKIQGFCCFKSTKKRTEFIIRLFSFIPNLQSGQGLIDAIYGFIFTQNHGNFGGAARCGFFAGQSYAQRI